MAAVLCSGLGSCCDCLCKAPCKLCGNGCRGCGSICSSLCKGLCGSPLSAYVFVTVVTQVPIVIVSFMEGIDGGEGGCKGSDWLLGTFIVGIIHIIVAFYGSYRVTNRFDKKLRENDRHTSSERISYLLCHDPIIAGYILVWFFFVAWLCVGVVGLLQNDMDEGYGSTPWSNGCQETVEYSVSLALGLGWAYVLLAPTVLSIVMCCTCFSKRDYVASDAEFEAKEQAQASDKNNHSDNDNHNDHDNTDLDTDLESPTTASPTTTTTPPTQLESKAQHTQASMTPSAAAEPKTYSVEGIPIDDKNSKSNIYRAEKQQAVPEVVAEELPPPMLPPPARALHPSTSTVTSTPTPIPTPTTSVFGGWFGGGDSTSTSKQEQLPDRQATLY